MRAALLLCLGLSLAACATTPTAYEQAAPVYVPVGPPPVVTPGYYPGTPAEPVYTPPGTGLPDPGQPGYGQPELPRSPNKRILPATMEPGLWAADGEPVASAGVSPHMFGVELPLPADATTSAEQRWTQMCINSMNKAAYDSAQQGAILGLPWNVRRCLTAQAYEFCTGSMYSLTKMAKDKDLPYSQDVLDQQEKTFRHAAALAKQWCLGSGWGVQHEPLLSILERTWAQDLALRMGKKP